MHCTGCGSIWHLIGFGKEKVLKFLNSAGVELKHLCCVGSSAQSVLQNVQDLLHIMAIYTMAMNLVDNVSYLRYKVWLTKKIPPKCNSLPTTEAFAFRIIKRCLCKSALETQQQLGSLCIWIWLNYEWEKDESASLWYPVYTFKRKRLDTTWIDE